MTKFTLQNIMISSLSKTTYKTFILFYSFYMVFFTQVFALQAEAPLGSQSFKEVVVVKPVVKKEVFVDKRVEKIESYYRRYSLPLAENAADFIASADRYNIDWRLVAAIGMIESTGGKHACSTASYSAFGWGSCNINFDSYAESINVISRNLAGKNPNTAMHYAGKDIRGILWSYNPDTIRAGYGDMVIRQMEIIESQ